MKTLLIPAISSLATILIIAGAWASALIWKSMKGRAQMSTEADLLGLSNQRGEARDREIASLREDVASLRSSVDLGDKRQYRTELAMERKDRLHLYDRQEIEKLEEIIYLMLPALAKSSPDIKREVDAKLQQLSEHRVRIHKDQMEWEERKDALTAFMGAAGPEGRAAILAGDNLSTPAAS